MDIILLCFLKYSEGKSKFNNAYNMSSALLFVGKGFITKYVIILRRKGEIILFDTM